MSSFPIALRKNRETIPLEDNLYNRLTSSIPSPIWVNLFIDREPLSITSQSIWERLTRYCLLTSEQPDSFHYRMSPIVNLRSIVITCMIMLSTVITSMIT